MEKRTKSLLQEINSISPKRDKTQLIESRGKTKAKHTNAIDLQGAAAFGGRSMSGQ